MSRLSWRLCPRTLPCTPRWIFPKRPLLLAQFSLRSCVPIELHIAQSNPSPLQMKLLLTSRELSLNAQGTSRREAHQWGLSSRREAQKLSVSALVLSCFSGEPTVVKEQQGVGRCASRGVLHSPSTSWSRCSVGPTSPVFSPRAHEELGANILFRFPVRRRRHPDIALTESARSEVFPELSIVPISGHRPPYS